MSLAIAGERSFGTLDLWLVAPQGLASSLAGKSAVFVLDGLLSASVTVAILTIWTGNGIPVTFPELMAVLLCASVSGAAVGVGAGSLSVRFRDEFTAPNLVVNAAILLAGVVVPVASLPFPTFGLGEVLPLANLAEFYSLASRDWSRLLWEFTIASIWAISGWAMLLQLRRNARRSGKWSLR